MASVGSVTGYSWAPQGLASWAAFSLPILSPGGAASVGTAITTAPGSDLGSSVVSGVGVSIYAVVEADRVLKAAAENRVVRAI